MRLSLIVPCYNEQENVYPFFDRIVEVFGSELPEVIFIDDGSVDDTLIRMKEVFKKNDNVRVLSFTRNFGKEAAILAGLRASTGDLIGIIDGDLQQDPAVAKEMAMALINDEAFDVAAAFQETRRDGAFHRFCKKCFYRLSRSLCDLDMMPDASDFRVMRRKVAEALLSAPETDRFTKGLFAWTGFKTLFFPYTVQGRHSGKSKWNTASLTRYATNGIISFSDKPLVFSLDLSVSSLILSIASLILCLFFGAEALLTILLPLILFGFSLVFFALWIIGKYVAMALREAKRRPLYVIREDLKSEEE